MQMMNNKGGMQENGLLLDVVFNKSIYLIFTSLKFTLDYLAFITMFNLQPHFDCRDIKAIPSHQWSLTFCKVEQFRIRAYAGLSFGNHTFSLPT